MLASTHTRVVAYEYIVMYMEGSYQVPTNRVVSMGQCNTCLQFICRSLKSQSFSGALI